MAAKTNLAKNKKYKNKETNDNISYYLNLIKDYPVLSAEKEKELSKQAKKGDEKARELLIKSNLRFVVMIAKKYQTPKLPLMDIINEGNIGLTYAIDKFDHTKGVKLTTYAIWWIKWSILKAVYEQTSLLRIPQKKANDFLKVKHTLDKNNIGNEYIDNISSKMSRQEYQRIKTMFREYDYLDSSITNQNNDIMKMDQIADDREVNKIDNMIDNDMVGILEMVISSLPEKEKKVVIHRYGLFGNKKLTLVELAKKFGCTKERIRQIEKNALRELSKHSVKKKLYSFVYN